MPRTFLIRKKISSKLQWEEGDAVDLSRVQECGQDDTTVNDAVQQTASPPRDVTEEAPMELSDTSSETQSPVASVININDNLLAPPASSGSCSPETGSKSPVQADHAELGGKSVEPAQQNSPTSAFENWDIVKKRNEQLKSNGDNQRYAPFDLSSYYRHFFNIDINNNNTQNRRTQSRPHMSSASSLGSFPNVYRKAHSPMQGLNMKTYDPMDFAAFERRKSLHPYPCNVHSPQPMVPAHARMYCHPYMTMADDTFHSRHVTMEPSPRKSFPVVNAPDSLAPTNTIPKTAPAVALPPNLELINGGYGIKNPILSPECSAVKNASGNVPRETTKFVCKVCHQCFEFPKLLQRHMKTHSDVKRYLCTFCGKGFNDTFDLKRHTRTHTGVRPYKCDICDKAFTQRCSLESHCRKIHGLEFKYSYKERRGKVYVCEDCGHVTNDPEDHFVHIKDSHPYNPTILRCYDKRQFKFGGSVTQKFITSPC